MSQRLTNILGYLTLFAILGAIWVLFGEDPTREQGGRGEPTFDGIKDQINDVTEIALRKGEQSVTLQNGEAGWTIAERSAYPADASKVRAFLRGVALSERRDPKTANPDRFNEIGLGDEAVKVALASSNDTPLLTFDMGKQSSITADRSLTYIWQEKDTRAWLVTSLAEAEADPAAWLDTDLLDIAASRVARVTMRDAVLARDLGGSDFALQGLAESETPVASWRLGEPARVIRGLSFDDVRHLGNPITDPKATVVLTTFDGLTLSLALHDMEGATWAQIEARFDQAAQDAGEAGEMPNAPEDGAAEAAEITAKSRGWFYRLSDADARVLLQARGDLLEAAE